MATITTIFMISIGFKRYKAIIQMI